MSPINANVTNNQITASVGETQIDVAVSGGVGPTGNSGTIAVAAPITNAGTSTAAVLGLSTGTGLAVSGGSVSVTYGSSSGSACQGNDSRLSDSREWSASTVSQAEAETGTATDRRAFTPLRVFQAIAAWWAGSSAKTKLDGIATGATANQSDAYLVSRANHTGTQTASTISDFTTAVIAAAPPTTNASLLTSGTLPDARLSSNIARTSDVSSAVAALVNSSPAALDTLGELATALGNDANFSTTVTNALAAKAATTDARLNVTWPVRAVHVGGLFKITNGSGGFQWLSPTWPGDFGDLATFGSVEHATQSITVNRTATLNAILAANPGWSLVRSSLEIALVDCDNRVVGWGTTESDGNYGPTHGNGGHIITVSVGDFPVIPAQFKTAWALSDDTGQFVTSPAYIFNRPTAYKKVASRLLDIDEHEWTKITNRPTFATVATSGSAADLTGTLAAARLPATAVTAGSYGSASSVGTFTVDAAGRLTAAGSTSIAISAGAVSGLASVATAGTFASLSAKPTTLSGYGITDAVGSTDARLSDARTPSSTLAHASSHASGGTDALSLAGSQITSGSVAVARLPTVLEQTVTGGNTSTAVTLSLASGSVQTWTLNGNCTFTMPTAAAGASLTIFLTQSATNTATFTGVKWSGGIAPTITATANKVDVLVFVSDGTSWYGTALQNF